MSEINEVGSVRCFLSARAGADGPVADRKTILRAEVLTILGLDGMSGYISRD